MSIWAGILGGAAGFAVAGPLGGLIGAVAGNAIDALLAMDDSAFSFGAKKPPAESVAFSIAVVALGAKMAKADGVVSQDELAAFRRVFQFDPHEEAGVLHVFNAARRSTLGFESYAQQVADMFRGQPEVLENLLDGLFHIAAADGTFHADEVAYLHRIARIFGFSDAEFARIMASNGASIFHGRGHGIATARADDSYTILGLTPTASEAEVKAAYRQLIKTHHPDRVMAQGLPQDCIDLATQKMAAINAAYDSIMKQRSVREHS